MGAQLFERWTKVSQVLTTDISDQGGIVVMAVDGRIDHDTAAGFQEQLLAVVNEDKPRSGFLVLDFSKVNYISSVGLRALMLAAKACKNKSGAMAVAAFNADVGDIFQIARFGFVVKLFDDLDDAVHALTKLADG